MSKLNKIKHKFVEHIPDTIDDGVLYISIPFNTAVHKCLCGCGNEVITPLTPTDWQLTYDGDSISLHPSIGNWSFDCQSHYWILNNKVRWSRRWSRKEINEGRKEDQEIKQKYFTTKDQGVVEKPRRSIRKKFSTIFR